MKNDIDILKNEFLRVRNMGLVKSMRDGSTGIGYTFESLLNKKEDQESKPDFRSIELKCKLGYSKTPLSLFNCAPQRKGMPAIDYIFNKYNHYRFNNKNDCKIFSVKIFSNYAIKINEYEFKLKVDYYKQCVILQSFYNGEYLEDVCYWSFKVLENKLKIKLSIMAIIYGYPYKFNDKVYYRYMSMKIYKLRGFFEFLRLIETDKIFIHFHLKEIKDKDGNSIIDNHGVCFKIRKEHISKLFYRIKY